MNRSLIDENDKIGWNLAYRIEMVENEGIFLFSEKETLILKGKVYQLLTPLLQRHCYSSEQIVAALRPHLQAEVIFYALINLEEKKLIQPVIQGFPSHLLSYCDLLGVSAKQAIVQLKSHRIYIDSLGESLDSYFTGVLRELHLQTVSDPREASFSIVVVKDYLQEGLALHYRESRPWMLVKPYGSEVWVGPIFEPSKTPCWECLTLRLKTNRLEETYVKEKKGLYEFHPLHAAMITSTHHLALNIAATELFKRIVKGQHEYLQNSILTFDTLNYKWQKHSIVPHPFCTCSIQDSILIPKPLVLKNQKTCKESGFRSIPHEKTFEKYAHLVSSITGIIHELKSPRSLDSWIHVYEGNSNPVLPKRLQDFKINKLRSCNAGKGTTALEAKVGCLCECIERYSGEFHGDEPRILGSYQSLKESAIHPHDVFLFSEEQYLKRTLTNPVTDFFNQVSEPFLESAEIEWTPLWSMTEQRYKHFPTNCCYYRYPEEKRQWWCHANSNGCAAGNCLEEAILQGFFELVERDCIAIWWYNRLTYPLVEIDSFKHPYMTSLLTEYEKIGREVWVLDLTNDLNIPTFAALSRLKEGPSERIFVGFGTHLDVKIALLRSLTEMNQFLGSSILEEGDQENTTFQWLTTATVDNQPYLKGSYTKTALDYSPHVSSDLLEDILHCQKIVEAVGLEFLILDQTRPEIGMPVARVIIPGLRHFWRRTAPGRLYDVPVKMGWLKEPLKESELNPTSIFI